MCVSVWHAINLACGTGPIDDAPVVDDDNDVNNKHAPVPKLSFLRKRWAHLPTYLLNDHSAS